MRRRSHYGCLAGTAGPLHGTEPSAACQPSPMNRSLRESTPTSTDRPPLVGVRERTGGRILLRSEAFGSPPSNRSVMVTNPHRPERSHQMAA